MMIETKFPNIVRCGNLHVAVRNMIDVNTVFGVMFRNIYGMLELREKDLVLDAGANIGTFSLIASRLARHVYSVEPDQSNYSQLQLNLGLNRTTNVSTIKACLSNKNGKAYLAGYNDSAKLVTSVGREVNVRTIDRLMADLGIQKFDVVKMDIEGSEVAALSDQHFLSDVRELIIETHSAELELKITKVLQNLSFRVENVTPQKILINHLKNLKSKTPDYITENIRFHMADIKTYVDYGIGALRSSTSLSRSRSEFSLLYARK